MQRTTKILGSLGLTLSLALPAFAANPASEFSTAKGTALAAKRHGADDPPGDDRGGRGGSGGGEAEPGDDRGGNGGGGNGGGGNNGGGNGGGGTARSRAGVFKMERSLSVREGAGVARIVVERSRGQQGAASVRITAAAGTAKAGTDFQAASAVLSWGAGDGANKVFELPIVNDGASEPRETVKLTLSNATGGALIDPVRGKAVLNILDDDGSKACIQGENTLCLAAGRFQVEADWSSRSGGAGHALALDATEEGASFAFAESRTEALRVRVVEACTADGNFWVAVDGAGADDYLVKVTDTRTGLVREYAQTAGGLAETAWDTATFACGE